MRVSENYFIWSFMYAIGVKWSCGALMLFSKQNDESTRIWKRQERKRAFGATRNHALRGMEAPKALTAVILESCGRVPRRSHSLDLEQNDARTCHELSFLANWGSPKLMGPGRSTKTFSLVCFSWDPLGIPNPQIACSKRCARSGIAQS